MSPTPKLSEPLLKRQEFVWAKALRAGVPTRNIRKWCERLDAANQTVFDKAVAWHLTEYLPTYFECLHVVSQEATEHISHSEIAAHLAKARLCPYDLFFDDGQVLGCGVSSNIRLWALRGNWERAARFLDDYVECRVPETYADRIGVHRMVYTSGKYCDIVKNLPASLHIIAAASPRVRLEVNFFC